MCIIVSLLDNLFICCFISTICLGAGSRLPALDETSDGGSSKIPYSTHSPRTTPTTSRKSSRQRKIVKAKSMSQDSENAVTSLKGSHSSNPGWHRSADSGFASTDVDPNNKLTQTIQKQSSFSDNERVLPSTSSAVPTSHKYAHTSGYIHENNNTLRDIHDEHREDYKSELSRTEVLMHDKWNKKEGGALGFNHIYKVTDPLSSTSSQEFLSPVATKEFLGKQSWKFAQLSDAEDSNSEHGVVVNKNNVSTETSFITDVNANFREQPFFSASQQTRKTARPPSLSELPPPHPSLLNEGDQESYDTEDVRIEIHEGETLSPPSSTERKMAFMNASKHRGKSF